MPERKLEQLTEERRHADDASPARTPAGGTFAEAARSLGGGMLARKLAGRLARRADADGVAPGAERAVAATAGSSGSALPQPLQRRFEGSLGADLGGVRVHTGAASAEAAASVSARAYTTGSDIHFARGQYDPSSREGQHLLAHEVAHTVQQSGGLGRKLQAKLEVTAPGDAAEAEADRAADAMVAGAPAAIQAAGAPSAVARKRDSSAGPDGSIDEAGHQQGGVEGDVKDGKATAQITAATTKQDGDTRHTKSVTAGTDDDGGHVAVKSSSRTGTDEDYQQKERGVDVRGGSAKYTEATEHKRTDEHGNATTDGKSKSVTLGKDQIDLSQTTSHTEANADGSSKESSTTTHADLMSGTAGRDKTTKTTGADGSEHSTSVGGSVDVKKGTGTFSTSSNDKDASGKKSSQSFEATAGDGGASAAYKSTSKSGRTLSVSGSFKVEAEEPEKVDDHTWSVTWSEAFDVGGSVGKSGKTEGGKKGVTASGGLSETHGGVKRFGTLAAAQDFKEHAAARLLSEGTAVSTASDVLKMKVGEERTVTFGEKLGVGASASSGIASASAGVDGSAAQSVKVVRRSKEEFDVTLTSSKSATAKAGIAAGSVVGLSGDAGAGTSVTVEGTFRLPADQASFERCVAARKMPQSHLTKTTDDASRSTGHAVTMGLIDTTSEHTTDVATEKDAKGNVTKTTYTGTDSEGWNAGLFGLFNASHSDDNTLTITDAKDKERYYGVSTSTSGSDAAANLRALGEATGTATMSGTSEAASGKWTVTSYFSEDEIERFCDAVIADPKIAARLLSRSGAGDALRDALIAAGSNRDLQARALTRFVADAGARGIALIREVTGARERHEITLAGDRYFTGPKGREELAAKASEYAASLKNPAADHAGVVRGSAEQIAYLEQKLEWLTQEHYQDLPMQLLTEERERTRGYLTTFTSLHDQALAAVSGGDKPGAAPRGDGKADPDGGTLAAEQARVKYLEGQVSAKREEAKQANDACRLSRYRHQYTGFRSCRDDHAGTFGDAHDDYASADYQFDLGSRQLAQAVEAYGKATALRDEYVMALGDPKAAAAKAEPYLSQLTQAFSLYVTAAAELAGAQSIYLKIQARYAGDYQWTASLPDGQ